MSQALRVSGLEVLQWMSGDGTMVSDERAGGNVVPRKTLGVAGEQRW